MDQCKIERSKDILNSIEDLLYFKENVTLEDLEDTVQIEVPEIGDFKLAQYVASSAEFKESLEKLLRQYNLNLSQILPDVVSSIVTTKSNVASNFNSVEILDMFHTLPMIRSAFEGKVNAEVIKKVLIGNKDSKTYVQTNEEVTRNLTDLKNELFKQIQEFLISKRLLSGKPKVLINSQGGVKDYAHYVQVMQKLNKYFFEDTNFSMISTYNGKKIPDITVDSTDIVNAYNAGVFLNNFDSVISNYFEGIIDINYLDYNNLQTTTSDPKYKKKIEGLKTDYWLSDTHSAEGSENAETKIIKSLISTIAIYNKKNQNTGMFMEMKDFYLFAAKISDFEVRYGNQLKNEKDSTFKYFNEDPVNGLNWYLDEIVKASKGTSIVPGLQKHFSSNFEFAISLKNYLNSSELNIAEKDKNSDVKLSSIFSQVVNNNFGTAYLKYNANGRYTIQEMYKQNFNNIKVQDMLFTQMFRNSNNASFYNQIGLESNMLGDINEILKDVVDPEADLRNMSKSQKSKLGSYIGSKTGIKLSHLGVNELLEDLMEANNNKIITKTSFINLFSSFITALNTDFKVIRDAIAEGTLTRIAKGDIEVSDYLKESVNSSMFKAINNAYLQNTIVKPLMNVETFNGEKLPTFKVATLTHKDTELFELQRNFEKKNKDTSLYRSMLIADDVIIGTGTKLEAVNGNTSKQAAKFNESESFISDFQFEFLEGLISKNPQFSILIGNYSDKSTILTKIINANKSIDGKKPIAQTSIDVILEKVRVQAANYYKDLVTKVVNDYNKLLDLTSTGNLEKDIKIIDDALLKMKDTRDLSKKASDLGINFTEELHYSKYKDGLGLNRTAINNYLIFNDVNKFNEFVEKQEESMLEKFKKFNKNVKDGDKLVFAGTNDPKKMKEYIKALGLTDSDFEVEPTEENKSKTDYFALKNKKGLNPLLKKWMWLNALYRNEYLFISAKGEYMHPHKNKELLRGKVISKKISWENYNAEISGRLASMAKRNVLFTATIEVPIRKSKLGIPENVNMSVIDDYKNELYNLSGQTYNQDVHDGSSLLNYVYSKMIDNSYPTKGYDGTKKQFATFITEQGVTIKKDAESVITNDKIRNSLNSKIKFLDKQKQMLDLPIGDLNFKFSKNFHDEFFFNELGTQYRIDSIKLIGDSKGLSYTMQLSKKEKGVWKSTKFPKKGTFKSLYDLWNIFGGAFSTDANGNFNEGSNELLYKVVTTEDNDGNYSLKDKMIHILSNLSSVKAGGTNVNGRNLWTSNSPLAYATFQNRFMGPQLDASHHTDESQIKEVTQVISALAQNAKTAHFAKEAYQDIANVIKQATIPYVKRMIPDPETGKINLEELSNYLSEKFVDTILHTKGDNIAKVLVQTFSQDQNIPFSNQNFYNAYVKDIITRMNNDFITRYYSGTGAILIPSQGIIQLYDLPDGRVVTQADITKEALNNFNPKDFITDKDRVIYGHNAIGKSFLFAKGKSKFVSLDDDFKPEIDKFIDEHRGKMSRQDYKAMHPEEYNNLLLELWEQTKEKAKKEGKIAIVSNHHILRQRPQDFDKVITLPKEEFKRRLLQRGMNKAQLEKDFDEWKNNIDNAVSQIDSEKVVLTDKYLSDLFIGNNNDVVSSYINNMLKDDANFTWDKIQIGDTVRIGEEVITLDSPKLYYKYKTQFKPTDKVAKVYNVPRDLKPSLHTFTVNGVQQNTFDLLPVRLSFAAEGVIEKSELDKNIIDQFTTFIQTIGGTKDQLRRYLSKWTQRELDLLDEGRIMKSITDPEFVIVNEDGTTTIDFNKYFNEDTLVDTIYKDARDHYINNNSVPVENIKFTEAELILGDIYKSKFSRDFNDSMYEIKKRGPQYFINKILEDFKDDNTKADIKLKVENLDHPVYIRYVDTLPGNDPNITLRLERDIDENGNVEKKFTRYNNLGKPVYTLPNHKTVRVGMEDGKEIIYIKALDKIDDKVYNFSITFKDDLSKLIHSFKDNIQSFVPLMNNKINGRLFSESKEGIIKTTRIPTNYITLNEFSKMSGYTIPFNENINSNWYKQNRINVATQLGQKMFASWEKSHEFIAARIPSQSMQSFMPMRNVAYNNTLSNDAYVSIWQILLQGSDFDIDKAYILGYGFNGNGQFDNWSPVSNYSTTNQLNALEKLPLPSGVKIEFNATSEADLTREASEFFVLSRPNVDNLSELSVEQIEVLNKILRKINTNNLVSIKFAGTEEQQRELISLINKHNLYKGYTKKQDAVKNSVVTRIKQIISAPSNQILASTPVEVDTWHNAVKDIQKEKTSSEKPMLLSPYDMFSYYKQQHDASVGKDDVGIAANGLKGMFALSSYYNDYYNTKFQTDVTSIRRAFQTFKKELTFIDEKGNKTVYAPSTLSDVDISKKQAQELALAIGEYNKYRVDTALALSAFTSAATDNAKELLMAKVNATVELASMHIYLMTLGFTPKEIVRIMTSDVIKDITDKLESNIFFTDKVSKVANIFEKLEKDDKYKNDENKMTNLNTLKDIYQGAQEMKIFTRLLSVNQRTSANTEELTRYLTNFETLVYARENSIFGKHLSDFNVWLNGKDSTSPKILSESTEALNTIVNLIFENNKQLKVDLDKEYVKDVLKRASNINVYYIDENGVEQTNNVSLLGGKFDYRYYVNNKNTEYRQIAKEYYNLIKNTFNLFDIIENVPHFKEMINGVVLSYNILNYTSKKFNFVQNRLRDTVRNNADRIVFPFDKDINPNIVNQMGNKALFPAIDSTAVSKSLSYVDARLKKLWLESESTSHLTFNVNELINQVNLLLPPKERIKNFAVYMTNDARNINLSNVKTSNKDVRIVNEDDVDQTIISLNTDYGIANFKRLMEEILLPALKTKSSVLADSLRVQSVYTSFGLRGNAITSSFPLSSITNPVMQNKALQLLKAFNDLDINSETKGLIKNNNGKNLKWKDLFYVYNLIVNNDKYGDLRLTPLFQDYIKEKDSLGYDYTSFSSKVDSGKIDLFDIENDLNNDPNYIEADEAEKANLRKKALQELDNDILFYTFNQKGSLTIQDIGKSKQTLQITNPDFVTVVSITATAESKQRWKELSDVIKLIKSRGYIIKFTC